MVKGLRVGKESEIKELESGLLPGEEGWGEGWEGHCSGGKGTFPQGFSSRLCFCLQIL